MQTNKNIIYSNDLFTVKDLCKNNPEYRAITLRTYLKQDIERKKIIVVGTLPNKKGRPKLVMAKAPFVNKHIVQANEMGVIISFNTNNNLNHNNNINNIKILSKEEIAKKVKLYFSS